jgi:hypothetical protein
MFVLATVFTLATMVSVGVLALLEEEQTGTSE